jgi:hypothetical protein
VANTLPLLTASVASDDDVKVIKRLVGQIQTNLPGLIRLERYHEGQQRLEHIGLAVPPELRHFETVVNVPRMAVSEPERRQSLRAFYRVGDSTKEDPALREAWEFNNLGSESTLMQTDEKLFGRSFVMVGTNSDDGSTRSSLSSRPCRWVTTLTRNGAGSGTCSGCSWTRRR